MPEVVVVNPCSPHETKTYFMPDNITTGRELLEYVASFKTTNQHSPDPYDWEMITKTLKCTPETTIAEIIEWYRKDNQGVVQIMITELETLQQTQK